MTADDGRFYPKQPEQVSRNDLMDTNTNTKNVQKEKTSHYCRQMAHTCTQLGRDQGKGDPTLSPKRSVSVSAFPSGSSLPSPGSRVPNPTERGPFI